MKMFLTRLGFNSKMVVTGDITQIDLPDGKRSGLKEAVKILKNVEDIGIVRFSEKDVVRHRLVQDIIKAYEKQDEERKRNERKGLGRYFQRAERSENSCRRKNACQKMLYGCACSGRI